MPKPLRVAGEVDGYCTRCRLVLNHRIVSMNGAVPHQAECLTCRTTHRWRAGAPGTATSGGSATARGASKPGTPARPRGGAAAALLRDRWEKAMAEGPREIRPYNTAGTFREGDLVHHAKFGKGLVTRVIDVRKVEVLFVDEARTLAQGL
jgi:hypothetical protein